MWFEPCCYCASTRAWEQGEQRGRISFSAGVPRLGSFVSAAECVAGSSTASPKRDSVTSLSRPVMPLVVILSLTRGFTPGEAGRNRQEGRAIGRRRGQSPTLVAGKVF